MANLKYEYNFVLEKEAKSKGSDRYIHHNDDANAWSVYFPQEITRKFSVSPMKGVKMIVSSGYVPNAARFKLTGTAKNKGGDKYTSEVDPSFTVYMLQEISRAGGNEPIEALYVSVSTN